MTFQPDHDLLERGAVVLSVQDTVATVTLDRPGIRNAQSPSMWSALEHVGAILPDEVRVVVVRGSGPSFSAGIDLRLVDGRGIEGEADIPSLLSQPADQVDRWIERAQAGFVWLRDPRFVSVAVVQGHAFGAGFQLALACDYRIGTSGVRLCMKETALGLVPDLTGTKPLAELVGYSRALDIVATAREVPAEEALSMGILNVLVTDEQLEGEVQAAVQRFTAPVAGAVRAAKALMQAASENDLGAQRTLERQLQLGRLRELAGMADAAR